MDFGAGIGLFAKAISSMGIDVSCIEPDRGQEQVLKSHGLKVVSGLQELVDESIDYIYTLNVLEHNEDDMQALRDLCRVLSRGGKLFIYVPAFRVLFSSMDRKIGHYRRYRRADLVRLAGSAGFVVCKAEYVDSLGFFASLVYRAIGSQSGTVNERSLVFYDRFIFPISRLLDNVFKGVFGKNLMVLCQKADA